MENSDAIRLITAIFKRAVDDWRLLCNGSAETKDRNFKEIEHSFNSEMEYYLHFFNSPQDKIMAKLNKMRAKSIY